MTQSNLTFTESHEIPEGYKLSDLGQCPLTWEVKPVKDIAKVIDSLHMTPSFSNDGYPMVRVADIKTGNLDLSTTLKVNRQVFLNFIRNYKPQKNDIVLSRVGSYGVSSFVATEEEFCIGQNTVVIKSNINANYLYYALNSKTTWQQIENGSFGSGYKSLSLKNINELKIYVPEILEQQKIATALSDKDALISELEKLIEKKQAIKTATMQQLLIGKTRLPEFALREDGTPKAYKNSELGQIPEDWEIKQLGNLSIISRLAGAEYTDMWYEDPKGEIIALRGFNIGRNKIDLRDTVRITSQLSRKLSRSKLCKHDVVYPCVGTIGNAAVIHEDDTYHIQQNIARITPDRNYLDSNFLASYLISDLAKDEVSRFNATSSQPNVLVSSLRQYRVPCPNNIKEQQQIAGKLSAIDNLIYEYENRLNKLKSIKQGMMQELLTGKTRLV